MGAKEVQRFFFFLLIALFFPFLRLSGAAEPAAETPLGRRTRSAGIVINEGGRRAYSSAPPPRFVKPKTEPGLSPVKTEPGLPAVKTEHGDAALKWVRKDSLKMARERQRAALARFE